MSITQNHKSTKAKAPNRAPFVKAALPKKSPVPLNEEWVNDPSASEPKYTLLTQSSDLDSEISVLRAEIENLQRVLEPVMIGEQKAGDVFDSPIPRLSSTLGTQLDQMRVNVHYLALHVRSLADRVELV